VGRGERKSGQKGGEDRYYKVRHFLRKTLPLARRGAEIGENFDDDGKGIAIKWEVLSPKREGTDKAFQDKTDRGGEIVSRSQEWGYKGEREQKLRR